MRGIEMRLDAKWLNGVDGALTWGTSGLAHYSGRQIPRIKRCFWILPHLLSHCYPLNSTSNSTFYHCHPPALTFPPSHPLMLIHLLAADGLPSSSMACRVN